MTDKACPKCGAPMKWSGLWGAFTCRDCIDREYEESIRANMPEKGSGNDTHALPPYRTRPSAYTASLQLQQARNGHLN